MTRYALTIEFDGGPFFGLQRQDNGPSVQQAIEDAAFAVTGERVTMHSAGRTDSGVHARCQVVHFDARAARDPRAWVLGATARLPRAIANAKVSPERRIARDWRDGGIAPSRLFQKGVNPIGQSAHGSRPSQESPGKTIALRPPPAISRVIDRQAAS